MIDIPIKCYCGNQLGKEVNGEFLPGKNVTIIKEGIERIVARRPPQIITVQTIYLQCTICQEKTCHVLG